MRVWRMHTGISVAPTASQRRRLKAIVRDWNAAQKHVLARADRASVGGPHRRGRDHASDGQVQGLRLALARW